VALLKAPSDNGASLHAGAAEGLGGLAEDDLGGLAEIVDRAWEEEAEGGGSAGSASCSSRARIRACSAEIAESVVWLLWPGLFGAWLAALFRPFWSSPFWRLGSLGALGSLASGAARLTGLAVEWHEPAEEAEEETPDDGTKGAMPAAEAAPCFAAAAAARWPCLRFETATPGQGGSATPSSSSGSGMSREGPVHWTPRRTEVERRAKPNAWTHGEEGARQNSTYQSRSRHIYVYIYVCIYTHTYIYIARYKYRYTCVYRSVYIYLTISI